VQFVRGQGLDSVLREAERLGEGGSRAGGGRTPDAPPSAASAARSLLTGRKATRHPGEDSHPSDPTGSDASGSTSAILGGTEAGYYRNIGQVAGQAAGPLDHADRTGVLHRDIN